MALSWVLQGNLRGPQGTPGVTGTTGAQGPQGIQGPAGTSGVAGPQGPLGPTGAAGRSFDPAGSVATIGDLPTDDSEGTVRIVIANGHMYGRESGAWTDMGQVLFIGPTGPQGATGNTGAQGSTGSQGVQGVAGARGNTWESYSTTPPSLTGKQVGDWAIDGTTGDLIMVANV
jgi:hypothetical protein